MNDYDEHGDVAAPEPDRRIIAMARFVDLEQQHVEARAEADRRAKMAAVVAEELRQARDELYGLLGIPQESMQKASISARPMPAAF